MTILSSQGLAPIADGVAPSELPPKTVFRAATTRNHGARTYLLALGHKEHRGGDLDLTLRNLRGHLENTAVVQDRAGRAGRGEALGQQKGKQ